MSTWHLPPPWLLLLLLPLSLPCSSSRTYSARLIHRFSDEARLLAGAGGASAPVGSPRWPEKRSREYYELLVGYDLRRVGGPKYRFLFPSQGSKTMSFGNDFGWLHYTWINIGTPSVSFLVALDGGSDLLWLPCECIQCAPLSSSYYSSLDRDLNEYSPSSSSSSKHLTCSHELCQMGSYCDSPRQSCPYTVKYFSENTSSAGLLVEDVIHLASAGVGASSGSVLAPVVIGCGMKQSGGYLDGVAPDGLMGLGLGEISVPSFLAKGGLVRNSFAMCFNDDDSGQILFGDQGPDTQKYTSFLPLNGKYETYIVGVEKCCFGSSCLNGTSFKAVVDSGTSFTFLPNDVFNIVSREFDRRVNATRSDIEGYPFKYCYKSSAKDKLKVPPMSLVFPQDNSFVVHDPVFEIYGLEGVMGFCLAIQPGDGDIGTIGHNFMIGYRMVFDRDNLTLGWSHSDCKDMDDKGSIPLTPDDRTAPLPTNEQQSSQAGHAVAPAIAGRAPSKPSSSSGKLVCWQFLLLRTVPLSLLTSFPFLILPA
ncbi:hypothetical protein MLD38_019513 [Melastoma candidum]|uniref:Uncharacterized protein n=1 Tax=Melastoma candidum TaxID=119954 RepID=A0ACB9QYI4_9MYRT|nr:hypothetical protein MLD38_019513 [Melastoma candidum]